MNKNKHFNNILLIHDYPLREGGGVEIQTYQDAVALVRRGYSVCILTSRVSSETFTESQKAIYPQITEDGVWLDQVRDLDYLEKKIIDSDIVHIQATFSLRSAMMGSMKICIARHIPFVVSLRTNSSHIPFSALADMPALEREMMLKEFADLISHELCTIVGISQSAQDSLKYIGVDKKCHFIYNAKDWNQIIERSTSCDLSIKQADITYVGEVSWMKGMHVILGVVPLLVAYNPHICIRIIGNGQDKKQVKTIIDSLGLDKNIEFIPYVSNTYIPAYLAATKILVQPSLSESWGNIVAEALVMGTQVVVSNTEGLVELVGNGKYGVLFERGNVLDLYHKIVRELECYGDKNLRLKRVQNREYITETFTMDKRVDGLLNVYTSTLSSIAKPAENGTI